jgi:hypothetical protein
LRFPCFAAPLTIYFPARAAQVGDLVAFCDALLAARAAGKARIASLTADVERYRALSASREQQRKELLSQVAASAPSPSKRPRTPARRRGGAPVGFRA